MSRTVAVTSLTLFAVLACQGAPEARKVESPAPASAATSSAPAPATQAAAAAAPPYTIHIAAGDAAAGKAATSVVEVKPASGYHMNKEFPARLRVTPAAGVTLTKADLSKEDAELTDEHLRFSVAFNAAAAGKVTLAGLGDFSVCNDTTCKLIRDEKLSWDVEVKP